MSDTPGKNQHRMLLRLGSGNALLVGRKGEVGPLIRRGWVTGEPHEDGGWRMVRITPDGLRALARSVERYGLPELGLRR